MASLWGTAVNMTSALGAMASGFSGSSTRLAMAADGRIDLVISLPDIALRGEGGNFNFGVARQNADKLKPRIPGCADDCCSHMASPLNKKKEGQLSFLCW